MYGSCCTSCILAVELILLSLILTILLFLFYFTFVHDFAILFILVDLVILIALVAIRTIIVADLGLVQESLFIFIDFRVLFVLLIGLLDSALAELVQS